MICGTRTAAVTRFDGLRSPSSEVFQTNISLFELKVQCCAGQGTVKMRVF